MIRDAELFERYGHLFDAEDETTSLTAVPRLMVATSVVWFVVAGAVGLFLPVGRLVGVGTEAYYVAMTAHGAAVVFPALFQFMMGLSLLKSGGCLGKPVRGRLVVALYVVLNLGAAVYTAAVLSGGRWSYVLMFPLPVVGAEHGLWSETTLLLGVTGLVLILVSVVVLYPLVLLRVMLLGDRKTALAVGESDFTDPGMFGMFIGIVLLVVPGAPMLLNAVAVESSLLGLVDIESVPILGGEVATKYFFWIFAHNLMEAMGIMTVAVVYYLVPKYTGGDLYSKKLANLALLAYAIGAFSAFFHHSYHMIPVQPAGLSYHGQVMSWATGLGGALTVFTVLATLWEGGLDAKPAAVAVLVGFGVYIADGVGALVLSTIPWNESLHGTLYVSAHAMTVLTALAIVWAGVLYHYYPLLTGRYLDARLGIVHAVASGVSAAGLWLVFIVAGVEGVPRRVFPLPEFSTYLPFVLLFGLVFAAAQAVFLYNVLSSLGYVWRSNGGETGNR